MAETWKFNGTKLNVPQKVTGGEEDYIISGKSYLDDTYVEDFTRLYYDDTAKYLVFGTAGSWNGSNNTYASANILVLDTAPTGALLTFLQTYATKQLTLKQSVEQHITDAYTAIGNKSGTIPTQKNLANLAGAINTISTGVDTSDGNIEPTTVLKGYKGYAKGVAVDGAIETYDGTVGDIGFNITVTDFYASSGGSGNNNIYIAFDRVPTSTDYDYSFVTQTDDYTPIVKDKTGKVVAKPITISGVTTINVIETSTGSNVWFTVYSGTQRLIDITQDDRSGSYTFTQNITDMEWAGSYNE